MIFLVTEEEHGDAAAIKSVLIKVSQRSAKTLAGEGVLAAT